jgi:hypothetical protein
VNSTSRTPSWAYSPDQAQRAGIDHFCFGIEQYDPPAALAKLKAAVPSAQPTLENEDQVYVRDPDGVRVQFADVKYKREALLWAPKGTTTQAASFTAGMSCQPSS